MTEKSAKVYFREQRYAPELFVCTNDADFNVFCWDLSLKPGKHRKNKIKGISFKDWISFFFRYSRQEKRKEETDNIKTVNEGKYEQLSLDVIFKFPI
jgi:hypothetical protein